MRYWLIDFLDIIVFETNDLQEAEKYYYNYFECMRGVYDHIEDKYIYYNRDTFAP